MKKVINVNEQWKTQELVCLQLLFSAPEYSQGAHQNSLQQVMNISLLSVNISSCHEHESALYTIRDTLWEGLGLRDFLDLFLLFLQNLPFIFCLWFLSPKSLEKPLVEIVSGFLMMGPWPSLRCLVLLTWWSMVGCQCVQLVRAAWTPALILSFAPDAVLGTENCRGLMPWSHQHKFQVSAKGRCEEIVEETDWAPNQTGIWRRREITENP